MCPGGLGIETSVTNSSEQNTIQRYPSDWLKIKEDLLLDFQTCFPVQKLHETLVASCYAAEQSFHVHHVTQGETAVASLTSTTRS